MRIALALLVLTAACGRIGYDELAAVRIDAMADAPVDAATCPSDTTPITAGSSVCVELVERGNAPWTVARDTCASLGRRLCADAEWAIACTDASGLVDMANDGNGATPEWEWVAEEAAGVAQKRGYSACSSMSSHQVIDPYDYRCCLDL